MLKVIIIIAIHNKMMHGWGFSHVSPVLCMSIHPNRKFIYLLLNVSTPSFLLRGTGSGPDSSGTSCMASLVLILEYIRPLFKQ